MNRVLCIYPKDPTTEFLRPVYNDICEKPNVVGLKLDTIEDDFFLDKLSRHLAEADIVYFIGHGSSTCLYGTNLNPLIDDKMGNLCELQNKSLVLFACRSSEFISNHQFQDSLGFGFIPTSLDDVRDGVLHNLKLKDINSSDIYMFQQSIVHIWQRTLREVPLEQLSDISNVFRFYTNCEIVETLSYCKTCPGYKTVADMLYYLKEDMIYCK